MGGVPFTRGATPRPRFVSPRWQRDPREAVRRPWICCSASPVIRGRWGGVGGWGVSQHPHHPHHHHHGGFASVSPGSAWPYLSGAK